MSKRPTKIAFVPETVASAGIWRLIERARQMAQENGLKNATMAIENSLQQRTRIIDGFGKEYFDASMDGLNDKTALTNFLVRYVPKDVP